MRTRLALAAIAVFSITLSPAISREAIAKSIRIQSGISPTGHYNPCQYGNCPSFSYNSCSSNFSADTYVIQGGSVIAGKKPKESKVQLDTQLEDLTSYLKDQHPDAKLIRKGTVRLSSQNRGKYNFKNQVESVLTNYTVGEKLEIEVPADADIDVILEDIVTKGFNRIGTQWAQGRNNSNLQPVIFYRTSDLRKTFDNHASTCMKQAWTQWCKQQPQGNHQMYCHADYAEVEKHLNIQYMYVNGPQITRNNNRSSTLNIQYPWSAQNFDDVLFSGGEDVNLTGNLTIQLSPMPLNKKDK